MGGTGGTGGRGGTGEKEARVGTAQAVMTATPAQETELTVVGGGKADWAVMAVQAAKVYDSRGAQPGRWAWDVFLTSVR